MAQERRSKRESHAPFGVPTLPRLDAIEGLDNVFPVGDTEPEPLPPPPVEEPIPYVPRIQRPVPARDRLVAGRYEILEQVGTGGMGKIYKVRHLELGKEFALKIIHAELSENRHAREMFYAEARLASSLDHRNIVSITDFGEDIRRGAFIVMEYLRGEPLSDRLDRHRCLPPVTAVDIIAQTADALVHMHGAGVIHGDIKPENIFLARGAGRLGERRRNHVKVLDFGLSRLKRARRMESGSLLDGLAGTPAYLAPERCCGAQPDEMSDLYALGVLFYEVLTGEVPFDGNVAQILNAHIVTPPTPPSWRTGKGPVDDRFDDIILTCLAKDPAARFRSVREFLDELLKLSRRLGMRQRRHETPRPTRVGGAAAAAAALDVDFREMVASNPLPLFALDQEGRYTFVNSSFCLFLKKEEGALLGQLMAESRLAHFCPGLVEDLAVVLSKSKVTSRELEFLLGDGKHSRVLIWLAPLSSAGIVVGAHGVVHWIEK